MAPALRMTRIIKEKHKIFLSFVSTERVALVFKSLALCTSIQSLDEVAKSDVVASPESRTRGVSSALLEKI